MIRVLVASSLLVTLAACQHAGNEPHRERRAELAVEHPLNGTWHQAAKSDGAEDNTVVFDTQPLDRYWQVRGGSFEGSLDSGDPAAVDFAWDGFNSYWHPEPQHGYAGTVELTYSTRVYYGDRGNGPFGPENELRQTDYCNYSVSDDHSQVTFGEGCVLFSGTFNKGM